MSHKKKISLSGVRPTARMHIGNYLGAVKQFVDLQNEYDTRIFIADYHALTTVTDPEQLRQMTFEIVVDYLACGLDPDQVRLYRQSDVPAHAELQCILNNVVPASFLLRAHAYKDAKANNQDVNAGILNYPILMAADIIMYDADIIPVGFDQKQHVEYARDFAEKFNHRYGKTFTLPEPLIMQSTGTVPGVDGRKMSKSYRNFIPLSASDIEISEAVMSIPTDSQPVHEPKVDYEQDVVYRFHTFFTPEPELAKITEGYAKGGLSYQESKKILIESIKQVIGPIRDRRSKLEQKPKEIYDLLTEGAKKSRVEAEQKMVQVRQTVGLDPRKDQ